MRRIGYARVSTKDQELGLEAQIEQLTEYGVPESAIYIDRGVSGKKNAHGERMAALLKEVEESSEEIEVVVTKLDRWGRNPLEMEEGINRLTEMNASFTSLAEGITRANSNNSIGMLIIRIFSAVAAMERERIAERTREALAAARRRGVPIGPTPKLSSKDIQWIKQKHEDGWGAQRISKAIESERNVKVSKSTIVRVLGMDNSRGAYVPRDNFKYEKRDKENQ